MKIFNLLIAILFCQSVFGQVEKYTPSWTNYLRQTPEGEGKTNSSGDPVGIWSYYWSDAWNQDTPTETYNYDNKTLTCYGNYGILLETGQLNSDFKRTGEWREYQNSSEYNLLEKKGKYYDGYKHGKWDVFNHDTINPVGYENYTNGVRSGKWVTHDYKGDVINEENFKNGKYEGVVILTEIYGQGYQKTVSSYIEGEKKGLEKRYIIDLESTILHTEEGTYSNGNQVGQWHSYNSNGDLEQTLTFPTNYEKGSPIEIKRYYSTGEVLSTTEIKDFRSHGTQIQYHRNGAVQMKLTFENDNIMDLIALNDASGKALDGGNLNKGNGTLNEYDDNGVLSKVYEFEKSAIISTQFHKNGELTGILINYEGENNRKEIHYEGGQKVTELEVKDENAVVTHFENNMIKKKEIYLYEELVKTILFENGKEVQTIEE